MCLLNLKLSTNYLQSNIYLQDSKPIQKLTEKLGRRFNFKTLLRFLIDDGNYTDLNISTMHTQKLVLRNEKHFRSINLKRLTSKQKRKNTSETILKRQYFKEL